MIAYRPAHEEDIEALVELRMEFLREADRIQPGEADSVLRRSLVSYFTAAMRDGGFLAWLALDGARIVATSGLCFYTLVPSYKNLMNMYTVPSHRRRGIAAVLFEKVLDEARARGYEKVCLHARTKAGPRMRSSDSSPRKMR